MTPGRFPKHSFSGSYQVGPLIPSIQPTTTATTESPTTPGTGESLHLMQRFGDWPGRKMFATEMMMATTVIITKIPLTTTTGMRTAMTLRKMVGDNDDDDYKGDNEND